MRQILRNHLFEFKKAKKSINLIFLYFISTHSYSIYCNTLSIYLANVTNVVILYQNDKNPYKHKTCNVITIYFNLLVYAKAVMVCCIGIKTSISFEPNKCNKIVRR